MAGGLQTQFQELGVKEGDSPTLSSSMESASMTRRLLLDWDDALQAAVELVGYAELDDQGRLFRYLPQQDFEVPGLWATQINRLSGLAWRDKFDDEGGFGSANKFKKAVLEVQFLPRPYEVLDEYDIAVPSSGLPRNEFKRFVEVETVLEGSYLTVPITGLVLWSEGPNGPANAEGPQPFPGNIGKIYIEENYVFRWHQVPDLALPETTILSYTGRVNKTAFGDPDNPRLYFPTPGTLLLLGAAWRRTFMLTPDGVVPSWVIEYMMKYKGRGHNRFLDIHSDPMEFYQVTTNGTFQTPGSTVDGKCIYDEREFADLFDPSAG